MIQLCCSKEINYKDIERFFETYGILCISKIESEELVFFEVETKMLSKCGLCCWGKYKETVVADRHLERFKENQLVKDSLNRSRKLIFEDVSFWLSFVRDFLKRYSFIGLKRYYSDVDVDNGIKRITIDEFDDKALLNIDVNQMLLITQ